MIINQHNYEEFFLLYVDNELSASDKQTVEQFVQANPDLAIELEMLQQMQLPAEHLVFGEKKILFRNESAEITLTNHEEQFLLYVDNELDAAAKQKVETFVLQHPAMQESFTLLKQATLEPELVVFANKESLYRKEEKERRIFYMNWQRMAIAAVFIGLAVTVWNVIPVDKATQQNKIASVVPPSSSDAPKNNSAVSNSNDNGTKIITGETASINTNTVNSIASVTNNSTNQLTPDHTAATTNIVTVQNDVVDAKTNEAHKQEAIASIQHNDFETAGAVTEKVSGDNADIFKTAVTPDGSNTIAGNNDNVQPAVYRELDTEDEKKSLLLGSLEINKDKLRGFFRKAGSLFRSKAKTEEDKTETRASSPNTRSSK